MIIDNAIRSMSENLQKLGSLQAQAASGKRFEKSSDSPNASRAAMTLKSNMNANASYLETISNEGNWLTASSEALKRMGDLASEAINTSLEGISDTNAAARNVLADEIGLLVEDAISIGNSKYQDYYLFSGHQVNTAPFRFASGSPDSVVYDGDAGVIQRTIAPDQAVSVNFDADTALSPFYGALIAARDALQADDVPALQTALTDLQAAHELIKIQQVNVGIKIQQMEDSRSYLEGTQLALSGLLSREEDIDLIEVISELKHQEMIYQSVLQVGQRTLATVNLFDLMR